MRKAGFVLILAGLVLFLASAAHADTVAIAIGLNGSAPGVVASGNGLTSFSSGVGGAFGWTINVSVLGTPPNSEPTLESLTLDASNTSGGLNSIQIYVTELGLSSPTGVNTFVSGFTSNLILGGVTSVGESTFVDTSNSPFGQGSPLSSDSFTAIGNDTFFTTTPSLAAPFSETEIFNIGASGVGSTNDTISITTTPEPGTLTLFGTGLIGLAGLLRRKLL